MHRSADPPEPANFPAPKTGAGATPPGSKRLKVRHLTVFDYGGNVTHSLNTLRLEPREFRFQKPVSAEIRVAPDAHLQRFQDLMENVAHQFEIVRPHRRLEVESRVVVDNFPLVLTSTDRSADLDAYRAPDIQERTWLQLQESFYVSSHPEIWRAAVDVTHGLGPVFERAEALMHWVHREFDYDPASTDVNTHLEQAFELRRGVCQDFAHVLIGMCRSIGIPARYASGYLYNGPTDQLVGAQASHAWCEVFLPDSGWIGFDPTNDTLADARFAKVAVGRDYRDVAPVRGSYRGTPHCKMSVEVEVAMV